jgi:hypothetical protein
MRLEFKIWVWDTGSRKYIFPAHMQDTGLVNSKKIELYHWLMENILINQFSVKNYLGSRAARGICPGITASHYRHT